MAVVRFDGAMSPLTRPGSASFVVGPVEFADARVQRLVDEVQAHYVVIYGGPDDSPIDHTEFLPPGACSHSAPSVVMRSPWAVGAIGRT